MLLRAGSFAGDVKVRMHQTVVRQQAQRVTIAGQTSGELRSRLHSADAGLADNRLAHTGAGIGKTRAADRSSSAGLHARTILTTIFSGPCRCAGGSASRNGACRPTWPAAACATGAAGGRSIGQSRSRHCSWRE